MVRIAPSALETFAATLTKALGAPPQTAEAVAASLVAADQRGHDSHGVLRLPLYAQRIKDNAIDPTATPTIEHESPVTATIDGRRSFGQVVGRRAVDVLDEKASEHGIAIVGMRNATHLGRLGEWAERTTDHDIVFAGCISGSVYTVAPAGSHERRLSTNPIAFGVPTFDALPFPIVLDVATSQVAHGKIRRLALAGDPIPEGWTISESGSSVTDAAAFESDGHGAILPLGGTLSGYKGYGLSVIVELLSSTMGNAPIAGQAGATDGGNDAMFLGIDPLEFTSREAHRDRIVAISDYLKSTAYPDGISAGVGAYDGDGYLPGEPEYQLHTAQSGGIDLEDRIAESLCELAVDSGVGDSIPPAFSEVA